MVDADAVAGVWNMALEQPNLEVEDDEDDDESFDEDDEDDEDEDSDEDDEEEEVWQVRGSRAPS